MYILLSSSLFMLLVVVLLMCVVCGLIMLLIGNDVYVLFVVSIGVLFGLIGYSIGEIMVLVGL